MDSVKVNIEGVRRVGVLFEEFPDALYADLKLEISALTDELLGLVRAATPVRTGRLRSQVNARVFTDEGHIKGEVYILGERGSQDFAKAGSLEYGAHNPRRPLKPHLMRLDHYWDIKLEAPETVMVSAYSRTPNIEEHSFERGPLAAMAPEITARLNAVVEKGSAKANAG